MRASTVKSKIVASGHLRLEGKYYLNETSMLCMSIDLHKDKCKLLSEISHVENPPVFKRQFCESSGDSIQYFQSSDVNLSEEKSSVYINRQQAESIKAIVHEGDILVTGFGTIGNVRLVSKWQDGVCYANNVARIHPNADIPNGYLYAFMSSKYGRAQLNRNASGSVVRYIEAPGIRKTLIPIFPEDIIMKINNMIMRSLKLREEAFEALELAKETISENVKVSISSNKFGQTRSKNILHSFKKRFDANYHISSGSEIESFIKNNFSYKFLGDVCQSIWRPELFKRYYVKEGVTFLGSSDIFLAKPNSIKKLSKAKTANLNSLMIQEGTILIPRSGTIGNVALAHDGHAQKLASEDVIRLKPNDILRGGYIFAFLSSTLGKELIQKHVFGSVIQHVEPPHLSQIPIPLLRDEIMSFIDNKVKEYSLKIGEAINNEIQAIRLVEDKIETWNKN